MLLYLLKKNNWNKLTIVFDFKDDSISGLRFLWRKEYDQTHVSTMTFIVFSLFCNHNLR